MQITECRILENKRIGPDYFKFKIVAPFIAEIAKPGQFVHLRCSDSSEVLLRRPFSIHRGYRNYVEILYKVVGKGTYLLSKKRKGDVLDMLGPLGNGFEIPSDLRAAILVAGGMGVAPLLMLAHKIKAENHKIKVVVLIGAKTKKELLCTQEFKEAGCAVEISTDDGSKGFRGSVSGLLVQFLRKGEDARSPLPSPEQMIYACGPEEMLKKVSEIARRYNIPAQVSLEEDMPCGIGACFGCTVRTIHGYKLVCKDGPVFDANEIIWE